MTFVIEEDLVPPLPEFNLTKTLCVSTVSPDPLEEISDLHDSWTDGGKGRDSPGYGTRTYTGLSDRQRGHGRKHRHRRPQRLETLPPSGTQTRPTTHRVSPELDPDRSDASGKVSCSASPEETREEVGEELNVICVP